MAKGQKAVPVDEYTYKLLQRAVDEGKASNLADAILRAISAYLDVPYKSKKERKMEQDVLAVMELGEKAVKNTADKRR